MLAREFDMEFETQDTLYGFCVTKLAIGAAMKLNKATAFEVIGSRLQEGIRMNAFFTCFR